MFIAEASPRGSTIEELVAGAVWAEENGLDPGWVPPVHAILAVPGATAVPVFLAALAPRMLERDESGSPSEVAVIGTEQRVADRLGSYGDAGVTDLAAMVFAVGDDAAQR